MAFTAKYFVAVYVFLFVLVEENLMGWDFEK